MPGTATVTVTSEDGSHATTYTVELVPTSTSVPGGVGGTVPATLSLTLGGPASFGPFTPGADKTYTAQTTANVISTAGDATLSAGDPAHLSNGAFTLSEPLQVAFSQEHVVGAGVQRPGDDRVQPAHRREPSRCGPATTAGR